MRCSTRSSSTWWRCERRPPGARRRPRGLRRGDRGGPPRPGAGGSTCSPRGTSPSRAAGTRRGWLPRHRPRGDRRRVRERPADREPRPLPAAGRGARGSDASSAARPPRARGRAWPTWRSASRRSRAARAARHRGGAAPGGARRSDRPRGGRVPPELGLSPATACAASTRSWPRPRWRPSPRRKQRELRAEASRAAERHRGRVDGVALERAADRLTRRASAGAPSAPAGVDGRLGWKAGGGAGAGAPPAPARPGASW
jgi:hypothetical protein